MRHEDIFVALSENLRLLTGQIIISLGLNNYTLISVVRIFSLTFNVTLMSHELILIHLRACLPRILNNLMASISLRISDIHHSFVSPLISCVDVGVFLLEWAAVSLLRDCHGLVKAKLR